MTTRTWSMLLRRTSRGSLSAGANRVSNCARNQLSRRWCICQPSRSSWSGGMRSGTMQPGNGSTPSWPGLATRPRYVGFASSQGVPPRRQRSRGGRVRSAQSSQGKGRAKEGVPPWQQSSSRRRCHVRATLDLLGQRQRRSARQGVPPWRRRRAGQAGARGAPCFQRSS